MENAANGPDWTDVAMYLGALDALHGGRSSVLITTAGKGHNGLLDISIVTTFDVLAGSRMPSEVMTACSWPCAECKTFAAHIYNGLWKHDFAIGQAYQQRDFKDY